ncbi:MAG: AbrB/MazE/SpoVT family DNA-binding domain-containing protein [Hyphomicrobium aestuarii]|nr:AbrB/MazE/SpoVT family DNA-binding domain-containing protein [Hyphomicrobium aestuarii]
MGTTKLSSKGQIVIPKAAREAAGWKAGDELVVEPQTGGLLIRRKSPFRQTTMDEVVGCANYTGPRRTIEDMDAAIDFMFRDTASQPKRGTAMRRKTK